MQKLKFSVIIPTLNEERFLPRLLQNLTQQTYKNFETIIVDARSNDATVKSARNFQHKLPQLHIVTSEKRSLSWQRNLGVNKSKGDYLFFIDADSQIPEIFLQEVGNYLTKNKAELLTTWLTSDHRGYFYQFLMFCNNVIMEFLKIVGKPFACGTDIIVEKTVFTSIGGFRTDVTMSEDHDLIMRIFHKGYPLHILKQPRLVYCLRRFDREGLVKVIWKYLLSATYSVLLGPVTKKLYTYRMGGHIRSKK